MSDQTNLTDKGNAVLKELEGGVIMWMWIMIELLN